MPKQQSKEEIALQLKSAVYLHVAKIVEEKVKELNLQEENTTNDHGIIATPTFIAQLVELVYNQLINLGEDLELFCQHAGRDIVEPLDLYMVTRKNPTLQQFLKDIEQKNKE